MTKTIKPLAVSADILQRMAAVGVPSIRCESTVTDDGVDLSFNDLIGAWWDEATSRDVARILAGNRGKPVRVSINSPGGSAYEGISIYNLLAGHDGQVTTTVTGIAASAASLIAQAGRQREMHDNASIMLHRSMVIGLWGNAGHLAAEIKVLNLIDRSLARTYANRAGGTSEQWLERMRGPKDEDGTWYGAEEAHSAGLVDTIVRSDPRAELVASVDDLRKAQAAAIQARLAAARMDLVNAALARVSA